MRRVLVATLVVLVLAVLAVRALPARLLPRLMDDGQLRLSGLSGTLLDGAAARAMVATPAGFVHLGSIAWQLDPMSLLRAAPELSLTSTWGGQRVALDARQRGGRIELRDVDVSLRADLIRTLAPLAVDGRLSLQLDTVVLREATLETIDGRAVWQDAVWNAATAVHPLGTYAARLSTNDDGRVAAVVETLAGPVLAEGTITLDDLNDAVRYDIDLSITAGARGFDSEVERALRLFASPGQDGYRLRLDGDLAGGG